jgi:predicted ATPase with chaperone activity
LLRPLTIACTPERDRGGRSPFVQLVSRDTKKGEADGELLEQVAPLDEPSRKLITQAIERFRLSARGFHRVLRVARTLADLEGSGPVKQIHVAEALTYRRVLPGR